MQILRGRRATINHLVLSPDSRFLVTYKEFITEEVFVWDLHDPAKPPARVAVSGRQMRRPPGFLADGRLLVDFGREWLVNDPATRLSTSCGLPASEFNMRLDGAFACGDVVVSVESRQASLVKGWRLIDNGDALRREQVWSRLVPGLGLGQCMLPAASPAGDLLVLDFSVLAPAPLKCLVLRTADGETVCELAASVSHALYPRFAPDGSELFVGLRTNVLAWDTRLGGEPRTVYTNPQRRHFRDLAVSPDGRVLAGLTADDAILFIDRATGQFLRTYDFQVGKLNCVAFTPDGTRCVAGGSQGQVLLFDVE